MIEYHYNDVGSINAEDYTELITEAPYQKADVYLYGQYYIINALTQLASQINYMSDSTFYNIRDRSVFLTINSQTRWSNNLYLIFDYI